MTPEQRKRMEERDQATLRRAELAKQIAVGEQSMLSSKDDQTRRALDQKLSAMRYELQKVDHLLAHGFRESFGAFAERMGCEYIQLGAGEQLYGAYQVAANCILFQNGACSDGGTIHLEPPRDPIVVLKVRRHYVTTKLIREVNAFNQFKSECAELTRYAVQYPSCCPPPPADAADQLMRGKQRIESLRQELTEINERLSKTPEEISRRARQQFERDRYNELSARHQAINNVTI